MLWSNPQKGIQLTCYLRPVDKACSSLCSFRIPLHSKTPTPLLIFILPSLLACYNVSIITTNYGFFDRSKKWLQFFSTTIITTWSQKSLCNCKGHWNVMWHHGLTIVNMTTNGLFLQIYYYFWYCNNML